MFPHPYPRLALQLKWKVCRSALESAGEGEWKGLSTRVGGLEDGGVDVGEDEVQAIPCLRRSRCGYGGRNGFIGWNILWFLVLR